MRRRDQRREAEVLPPLTAPLFEHFDWWAPLLRAGEHYVHVQVPRRNRHAAGGSADSDVCHALQSALVELDATPGRARCIAERGQQLARSLSMSHVYDYMAGVLRGAAAAQRPEVARRQAERENVVTKRNLLRHLAPATRPWMERLFLPALHYRNSTTAAVETGAGGASSAMKRSPAGAARTRASFTFSR